ncbi:transcriptional regulator [Pasteurellaceae bacterium LFhippo2]|nr:transcriptional regulator [Pasteurellaceae bacterium LFhippo2]
MDKSLFNDLVASLNEMVEIETGKKQPNPENVYVHKIPNVKQIRASTNLKQSEFAKALGVSLASVQSWETQRRIPTGSSQKLLYLLEKQPSLITSLQQI